MICDVYDDIFDSRYLHEFFDEFVAVKGYNITNIANRENSTIWKYRISPFTWKTNFCKGKC